MICGGEFRIAQRRLNPQRLLKKRHPDYIGVMALMVDRSVPRSIGIQQLW